MKAPENPHRLVHDPRFRQWLASLAERRVESERLEKSGQVIRERIDELASKVSAASWIERTLWSRRFARVAVPVFLLVGMAAGAAHLWYSFRRAEPPSSPSQTGRALAINTEPEPEQPIEEPEPPKVKPQSSKNIVRPVPEGRQVARLERSLPGSAPSEPAVPESLLPEQVRLFREARASAREGEYEQVFSRLDELQRRFPDSPLGHEVNLFRAAILYRAERYQEATVLIGKLLDEPALTGKKAQLLRMLGDAWVHLGRCERAREAYWRALGLGLQGEEAESARRGLTKCAPR